MLVWYFAAIWRPDGAPRSELSADGARVEIDRHDFAFTREIADNALDIVRIGHPTSMNIDCRMCRVPGLVDPHTVDERSGRLTSDVGIAVAVLAPELITSRRQASKFSAARPCLHRQR